MDHLITPASSVRIEQCGVGFALDYTVNPSNATHYDVELYYAATNQPVERDTEVYEDDEYLYYINTPGVHTLYYKDMITGVTSGNFTIVIYEIPDFTIPNSLAEATFSITPANAPSKYLTMNVASNGATSVTISEYDFDDISSSFTNNGERWDSLSRAFTVTSVSSSEPSYHITSILTKNQYAFPSASVIHYISYSGGDYYRTECDTKHNTLDIVKTNDVHVITTNTRTSVTNGLTIVAVDDYYLIFSRSTDCNTIANNVALKYDADLGVTADTFVASDTSFRWKIDQIGINTPLIRQTQQYTCGPATFLQVLYGAGYGNLVPERTDTNANKIDLHYQMMTLAYSSEIGKITRILPYTEWLDVEENHWMGGTTQERFAERINEYSVFDNNATGQYLRWEKANPGIIGKSEIKELIQDSLMNGWSPFVWTDTGGTPYKLGAGGGHYICIIGFKETSSTDGYVIIANCHYHNNVLGIYAVPYSEFYDKIGEVYYYEP